MAGVEPYAPCPCGSGEKFKWCCQKVEAFADRAQRLFETGQVEGAIKILDEGLRKEKASPLLLIRKALMQIRSGQAEAAKSSLRQLLEKSPKNHGALVLLTRCVLETEGPVNGAGMFQQVLAAADESQRANTASLARVVAYFFGEYRRYPAAIKHLELVRQLGDADGSALSTLGNLYATPGLVPAFKDRRDLLAPPEHLSGDDRGRFDQALELAGRGLWASAAGLFYHLSTNDQGGEADYNLGLCRLWLGDEEGAIAPLRRRSRRLGSTVEAVDLEVLCQRLEPAHPDDKVEMIQLVWPLRNREALIANLRSAEDIHDAGSHPIDPEAADGPEVHTFYLLDRPPIASIPPGHALTPDEVPLVLAKVEIEDTTVGLDAHDDGRIDALGDRFTALAGTSIAAAHPRTKVLGEDARSSLVLSWEWLYPPGIGHDEMARLNDEKRAQLLREVWVKTPMPYLGFRTPLQAARDGDAAIPLRAAICQFVQESPAGESKFDSDALRAQLNIEREPDIDPESVDIDRLAVARLSDVPADKLDDVRLLKLYRRARQTMRTGPLESALRSLVKRPSLFDKKAIDSVTVYTDLSSLAASAGKFDESAEWLAMGRKADAPAKRGANAPLWDMLDLRLKTRIVPPEVWVPELAILIERYSQDAAANRIVLMNLVEMKLVDLAPNPDKPGEVLLDNRPLQVVMAEYGPRLTTASGRMGISATKPDVWTPGGPAGGQGGAIWTPSGGSGAQAGGDKSKLIIPGR